MMMIKVPALKFCDIWCLSNSFMQEFRLPDIRKNIALGFWSQKTWILVSALYDCMAYGKSFDFSISSFLKCKIIGQVLFEVSITFLKINVSIRMGRHTIDCLTNQVALPNNIRCRNNYVTGDRALLSPTNKYFLWRGSLTTRTKAHRWCESHRAQ